MENGEWITAMGSNRHNYANDVFAMYQKSYASIGMHIKSGDDLIKKYSIWELFILNGKAIAFQIKEKTPHGIKGVLFGSDGSKEGKRAIVKDYKENLERPFHYTELSGRPRELALEMGAKPVPSDKAMSVMEDLGHKPEKVDDTTYRRNLRNVGPVEKSMFGHPSDKKFPKEFLALSKRKLIRS